MTEKTPNARMRMRLSIEVDYELPETNAEDVISAGVATSVIEAIKGEVFEIPGAKVRNVGVSCDAFERLD